LKEMIDVKTLLKKEYWRVWDRIHVTEDREQ
jgi:hypothetical protein